MHEYIAHVRSVYDGDTCRVDLDLGFNHWVHNMPIRWNGVNTPEINAKDPEEKALAIIARDQVRSWILGRKVVLKSFKTGKYGRWMGTFWMVEDWYPDIPFEDSINQKLLDMGLAEELMKEELKKDVDRIKE